MVDFNSIFANASDVEGPVPSKPKSPWMVAFDAKDLNPAESFLEGTKVPEVSKKPAYLSEEPLPGQVVQPVDNTLVAPGVDKRMEMINPFLEQGLDMRMAIDAASAARSNRVDDVYNLAWDMSNQNPIDILKMAETDAALSKPSVTKLIREAKDRGLVMDEEEILEAVRKIKEEVPRMMGKDWFQSFYGVKYNSAMDAMEEDTSIYETMTRDMYAYTNPLMDETDRKRTSINNQIRAEKAKSIEDGRDDNKIAQLHMQLNSLGKSYTDPNGKVIDPENSTKEEQEYVSLVEQYMTEFSKVQKTDAKKLEEVFWEQYNFARAMDELYDKDVLPWEESQLRMGSTIGGAGGLAPYVASMPDDMKKIVDTRRDSKAKLSALSKLFLANSSPADVEKGVKYYGQMALKGFATGLMGQAMVSAVQDELGPTERDMLDITQNIMYSKDLPVTPEMERAFQRSVGEYAAEGASSILGMLPLLSVAGHSMGFLTTMTGLKTITTAWKVGNSYQKTAALFIDMGLEELKFNVIGFAPGGGIGDAAATRINPMIKFKNPVARGIAQFMLRPTMITSAMYTGDVTAAMVQDIYSYKDFNDILTERFGGGGREMAGLAISNFMFAFGGGKSISKEKYNTLREMAKKHRAEGREADAFWLEQQVKIYEKQDKAAAKVYRKNEFSGKSEAEIFERMKAAEREVMEKESVRLQVEMENRNLLERTVTPESLPIVMEDSKMRDSKGDLIPYFHGTDNVFNRFSKIGTGISTGGKANSRSRRAIFFAQNPEAAKTFGANVEQRYLNFKKPFKMGNVRGLTDAKIAQIEKEGYDGIVGWERINGVKEPVAASIGTRGIIKGQDLGPFQSKNAETIRALADQMRKTKINTEGIHFGSILPIDLNKAAKKAVSGMAKAFETTGDLVEAIDKGIATMKETGWYQKLSPELRSKFDPEIRNRLQKLLEEAKPTAVAKYDLERATLMTKEANEKYLPEFNKEGTEIASKHNAVFFSDVKQPENIVSKKKRDELSDVTEVEDMVRGTIVAKDMREFDAIAKDLKKAGYTVRVKRSPNSTTGYRGVTAVKRQGELGEEIQIHTAATLEAQRKAEALFKKYREGVQPKPEIGKIKPPGLYIPDSQKEGAVNLNTTGDPNKDAFTEPHPTYESANAADVYSKSKNLWVKPDGKAENSKRVLMGQFTSSIMGTEAESMNKASEYYASIYNAVPGYNRAKDFWEIPQWQAEVSSTFKNADTYVIRDVAEAKKFIESSGYKEVAFSVLDVTKEHVKALADALPDVNFNIGGYIDMKSYFKDNPNVKVFGNIEEMAKSHGVKYVPGYDYRNFAGTSVIPRLQLSTGCKYQCAFCSIPKKVEPIDKSIIDSQIESMKGLDSRLIYLDDKTFGQASNYEYLVDINKKLKEANPDFQGFIVQTTSRDFADPKKFSSEFIKNSGIKFVELGVETYNDGILTELNKNHSHKKYTDAAMENARANGVKVIPNIIVGFKQETPETYENTIKFLRDNKDIISHVNVYNLAVYESTPLAKTLSAEELAEASKNENLQGDPFHQRYLDKMLDVSKEIIADNWSGARYDQDMAESRKLFDGAYETFNDVKVGTSPAVTPLERKMRAMEMPVATQKELKKAWTEGKQQLLTGIKDVNRDMKEEFKQFVKDMPLTGLGVPLRKAMLNKVNQIDFTKPKSLERAIDYFDKIINDATFRFDAVQYYKGLTTLDKKTANLDTNQSGILKAKAGPEYLPTRMKLESIRKDMLEGDWEKAQLEIEAIYDKYKGDLVSGISLEDLSRIEELSFHGLLNTTNGATYAELQGANRTLSEIIKHGKTQAAAKRLIRRAQEDEFQKIVFDILNGNPKNPVTLDPKLYPNLTKSTYDKIMNQFDWVQTDSFFTFLDKLSKFDTSSDPYQSILNRQLGGSVIEADQQTFKETHDLYTSIQNKAKEVFGSKSNWELRRNSHERTKKLHTIEYTQDGVVKKMDITINQAYKKYMEFQDTSLEKSNDAGGYTKDGNLTDLGQKIIDLLPPDVKKWADWQLEEFYPMMYEIINPKYRELYGRDMPMGRNYSPIFVEGKGKESNEIELLANQNMINTATNGSLKTRVNHANELKLMDGDRVLLNYVDKMIYFKNWSDALSLLNNTFIRNQNNRLAIDQNFKPMYNKVAENFINEFSRKPKDLTNTLPIFEKVRNNFAVASLALKPTVFFAQVTAMPAYLEKVPTLSYAKEFTKFFTDPEGSWDILQEIRKDPFWQQRYGEGWDRDVINSMRQDMNSLGGSTWNNWKNASMFMTKYGDMFTVISGGLPLYRHTYSEAMKRMGPGNERLAKGEALAAFAQATRESQQAGQSYDLSVVQRASSFTKLLTMYKTSPFQYHRKVTGAVRNLAYGRGEVSGNIKTLAIYHVILPQIFQMVGNGFKWDQDDQLRALAFGNINEIFVLGDLMEAAINAYEGLPFEYQLTPVESTGKSLQKAVKHITASDLLNASEDVDMTEIWKALEDLGNVTGDAFGLPVRGTTSLIKGVVDVASGKVEGTHDKTMRILGWSDRALEGGKGFFDSSDEEESFLRLLNDTKNPTLEKARNTLPPYSPNKTIPAKSNKVIPAKNNKTIPKL